ncbi:MAG TPA: hypothetical protein VIU87_11540 [Mycobacterium sp.]
MTDPPAPGSRDIPDRFHVARAGPVVPRRPRWVLVCWVLLGLLVVAFLVVHAVTGGLGQH